ncbi:MAG: hypothetical protein ACYTGQ_03520, partial [Planctomycetota bacterium]
MNTSNKQSVSNRGARPGGRARRLAVHAACWLTLAALLAVTPMTLVEAQDGDEPRNGFRNGIRLNFQDATVDMVLDYLSEEAGMVIVKDVEIEGTVTLLSRQPLSVDEVVSLLNSVLHKKGYAAVRSGRTLKLVTLEEAKKANIPVRVGNDPKQIPESDEIVTQV